ncbi:MAG: carbamate kinase [Lachnospiraceae bacterium]|nr:carbamate kinase [Lachnospiraceae bacterium]
MITSDRSDKNNKHRIVVALGGNALGENLPEQMAAVKITAKAVADLIEEGYSVAIAHGNGPQVGMIQEAFGLLTREDPERYVQVPLSVCVALSQGYIGYDIQNALREELLNRGIEEGVVSVLTQVEVNPEDPAFKTPEKPIGHFMTREEADKLVRERNYVVHEDSGRGFRRVVASPKPETVVEKEIIKTLLDTEHVVICCGGGGIPVIRAGVNHLKGAAAVIDKDLASGCLAEEVGADTLMILTAVDRVSINFGKPDEKKLDLMTVSESETYMDEGQFAPGSMLPKVQAAVNFVKGHPERTALIAKLQDAVEAVRGNTGTRIIA